MWREQRVARGFTRGLRRYPLDVQASFFTAWLEDSYHWCVDYWASVRSNPESLEQHQKAGDIIPDSVPRPAIEEAGRMWADINTIPEKSETTTLDELGDLAAQHLMALNQPLNNRPAVRIVEGIDRIIGELGRFDEIVHLGLPAPATGKLTFSQEDISAYNEALISHWQNVTNNEDAENIFESLPSFGPTIEYPLSVANHVLEDTARKFGLYSFISFFNDSSHNGWFFSAVLQDMLEKEGWDFSFGDGQRQMPNSKTIETLPLRTNSFPKWMHEGHPYDKIVEAAIAWEVMLPLMVEEGYRQGNPYRPYVTILRPGLWPLGWDGKEFLVAQTLPGKII